MCSTNNINAINAGENDRRFCVITCNNKKANDKLYFKNFDSEIVNNEEAIRCIYQYLKMFPIEEFVPNRLFQEYRPTDDALYEDLKEYNKPIEFDFLENLIKDNYTEIDNCKIKTKDVWNKFECFLTRNGEAKRIEGITSKKFHFAFKQKVCQVIQNTPDYEDAILYSTRDKRIAMGGDDCYLFNIPKLKKYLKINDCFVEDHD